MLYHVRGELIYRDSSTAVVECGGVGYKTTVSLNTSESLAGKEGESVRLFTHLAVREDGIELFGFFRKEEMEAFRLLTSVSGIGPKAAMAILSLFTPERLAVAIVSEDARAIAKANGVGPKSAARVVLELKDKMKERAEISSVDGTDTPSVSPVALSGATAEAADALAVLGYNRSEINTVLRSFDSSKMTTEEIIRTALGRFIK